MIRKHTRHATRSALIVAAALVASLGACSVAAADGTRSVTATDQVGDVPPTISGVPDQPDIAGLSATYDPAGSFSIQTTFATPLNQIDTSTNYAFSGSFSISGPGDPFDPSSSCGLLSPAAVNGQFHVLSSRVSFYNQASVGGYSGTLPLTRGISPDQTQITITGAAPALANRDYRCLMVTIGGRRLSTISNIDSRYDAACDCWYIPFTGDSIGSWSSPIWFTGYAPAPPPGAAPNPVPPVAPKRKAVPRWETPACKRLAVQLKATKPKIALAKRAVKRARTKPAEAKAKAKLRKIASTRARYVAAYRNLCAGSIP